MPGALWLFWLLQEGQGWGHPWGAEQEFCVPCVTTGELAALQWSRKVSGQLLTRAVPGEATDEFPVVDSIRIWDRESYISEVGIERGLWKHKERDWECVP